MQLLVPGGSTSTTNLDVDFSVFQNLVRNAINPANVEFYPSPAPLPGPAACPQQ